jgi:hypothetical protein
MNTNVSPKADLLKRAQMTQKAVMARSNRLRVLGYGIYGLANRMLILAAYTTTYQVPGSSNNSMVYGGNRALT